MPTFTVPASAIPRHTPTIDLRAGLALGVAVALTEDVGTGDLTARLVPADDTSSGRVITREAGVVCGRAWVDEVFRQVSPDGAVKIEWLVDDGARVAPDDVLFRFAGPSRALLTGERTALNFLQLLSGTATAVRRYADAVAGTGCVISDTRKTLPGLRNAQKYAVTVGGGVNHRVGLYDGILIKENHIAAAGGIGAALAQARALGAQVPLMTEAETLDELDAALAAGADLVLIDDFPLPEIVEAVARTRVYRSRGGHTVLEYSGGATLETARAIAEAGVDRIAVGGITKHVRALDLSMRITG